MSDLRQQILNSFVSRDEYRDSLREPKSWGAYTYASDGRMAVQVPRIAEDADDHSIAPRLERWIEIARDARLRSIPPVEFPEAERDDCAACDGSGKEHECPDCCCDCPSCDGTGEWVQRIIVRYNGTLIDGRAWRLISALPNARVADAPNSSEHILFDFDGGAGLIMRMRRHDGDDAVVDVKIGGVAGYA